MQNNNKSSLSILFENPPIQWGLRGDPHLWEEMRLKTKNGPLPKTMNELKQFLYSLFAELTGAIAEKGKNIYVQRFAEKSSGMSRGAVSCDFWIDKGFPLIIERYISLRIK